VLIVASPGTEATTTFCIPSAHPAIPGHFPGAPVVPGVLLLAEGLQRFAALSGAPLDCRRIDSAKFLQPVAPGATVTATLNRNKDGLGRIEFYVGATLVAHMTFLGAATDGSRAHG
jgi:3-hydroxymyristoyl/3-hydroxydecanoyl-(acyl carrier protein) dehydratase